MTPNLADFIFVAAAMPMMIVTALRPTWTIYLLSYGHPERYALQAKGVAFMQFTATVAALGAGGWLLWQSIHFLCLQAT